ncbi:MAG: metal-dependent transcriptional regulator [Actinomycetota bacterium]|nr:metal-dependent transcriptional regulator [Actinomycetota bacterium]
MAPVVEPPATTAIQDYAKAIYSLERRSDGEAVATNDLAAQLAVSSGSVSAMLRRLAELGLVEHERYHGVRLSDEGRRVALRVIRRHRLLELFLVEVLDVPWDLVHREAEILEHALSDELVERVAVKLGHPSHDPHGDPIPSADLTVEEQATVTLGELEVGERGTVARVSDADSEMLRYLQARDVGLGTELEVIERQPIAGLLVVRAAGAEHQLGGELARAIRIAR